MKTMIFSKTMLTCLGYLHLSRVIPMKKHCDKNIIQIYPIMRESKGSFR